MLEVRDLSVTRGGQTILDRLSLSVKGGEFVSILGPSGAGKSTLFSVLTGALRAEGEILLDGAPLCGQPFAFMPQRDALMPWRRTIDNVTLGLEVQGIHRTQARARTTPLFAEFGLAGFERHWPHQLSGGMRQRAALMRTVVQDKPMLLLDEPFGALDALTRAGMQRWLKDRWQAHRWTTLLVTHDVREAVLLSDRIYVLSARPARVTHEFAVTGDLARLETQILETLLEGDA